MFNFLNLDNDVRQAMLAAIAEAERTGNIYYSARFNDAGRREWLSLFKEAASTYNEHWLAYQLEAKKLMKDFEMAQTPSGGYTTKHVPHTAAETMAEGQFNRFYILGLCLYARAKGIQTLTIYRGKTVANSRGESENLIGTSLPISELENQLKETSNSFKSALCKPNSGLSVKLP